MGDRFPSPGKCPAVGWQTGTIHQHGGHRLVHAGVGEVGTGKRDGHASDSLLVGVEEAVAVGVDVHKSRDG